MKDIHNIDTDILFDAILSLKNKEECYTFFEDICTLKELEAISQRYLVARQLDEGKNYNDVSEDTGASSTTICRVNKCLQHGGGYRMVLDRMKKAGDAQNDEKR